MQYSPNMIISITNDSSKDHGDHFQLAWFRWTSSWRSISLYPRKFGRCSQIFQNPKIWVSRHLDSSTTTQMAKIMVQYRRPSRSSWTQSVLSSFGRTIVGKAFWENPIETNMDGRKFQIGNVSLFIVRKGLFLSVYVDDKIGWKETKYQSDVEITQQRGRFGRTNIFLWSFTLGLQSKTMWNKQRYSW